MTLEQVVHRIATDSAFAAAFRADSEATLRKERVILEPEELRALMAALEPKKTPSADIPWYVSQISRVKPQAEIPWYEAQLNARPT